MKRISPLKLRELKAAGEKIAVITSYDASFARAADRAGIEVILVGDSLGMVLQGHDSTVPVTLEQMAYHTRCVSRGANQALVIADMPFGSYNTVPETLSHATELMQAGAQMVKLEGGQWLCESVRQLNHCGIPVCGHLGLTPQSVNVLGGYRVQGRDEASAKAMLEDAKALQSAGIQLLVLECVPQDLAADISKALEIPVIGIGAGAGTDAQVLVLHDLLGLSDHTPRFVRNFMSGANSIPEALSAYREAVKSGEFPAKEHAFS